VPSGTGLDWQIQVSQYDGDEWNLLGPLSDDIDSASRGVALAVGGEQPFVAWHPSGPDPGEIAVASWNGSAWDAQPSVPLPSADAGAILTPVLRIARDLRPIILWSTGDRYFIAGRTRTGWAQDFGIIPITSLLPFDGNHFDMILDDADNPIVSWINPNGTGHVATWAGGAWTAAPDALRVDEAFMALDSRRRPMQVVSGGSGALLVQQLTDDNEWQLVSVATVPPQAKDGIPARSRSARIQSTRHPGSSSIAMGPPGLAGETRRINSTCGHRTTNRTRPSCVPWLFSLPASSP
jgi:hypothetical protein